MAPPDHGTRAPRHPKTEVHADLKQIAFKLT